MIEKGVSYLLIGDGLEISAEYSYRAEGYFLELTEEGDPFYKDLGWISFEDLSKRVSEGRYKVISGLEI